MASACIDLLDFNNAGCTTSYCVDHVEAIPTIANEGSLDYLRHLPFSPPGVLARRERPEAASCVMRPVCRTSASCGQPVTFVTRPIVISALQASDAHGIQRSVPGRSGRVRSAGDVGAVVRDAPNPACICLQMARLGRSRRAARKQSSIY